MDNKKSIISLLGIPQAFSTSLLLLALILTLAPYLANTDFGIFKVPDLNTQSGTLKWLGPLLLLGSCLICIPFIEESNDEKEESNDEKREKAPTQVFCECELEDLLYISSDGKKEPIQEENRWAYEISNCKLVLDEYTEEALLTLDANVTDDQKYESLFKVSASGKFDGLVAYLEYFFQEQERKNRSWNGFMILRIPNSGLIYGSWMTTAILAHEKIGVGNIQLRRKD